MVTGLTYASTGGVRLCIRDRGRGPTVVLLHGTSANLGVWDRVVEMLGSDVRTVAVDQRGHGRSDKPPAGYGAPEFADDVAGLVRTLACAPAIIVGHSLGARNAVVAAARHPELVAGVVAVDYTPYVEPEVLDDLQARVEAGNRAFAGRDELVSYLRGRYPLIADDAVERRADYGYGPADPGLRPLASPEALMQTVDGLRADFVDDVVAVGVPVTVIRGELSRIVSAEAMARTRSLRPDFRVVQLPDVDHYVPEERPDVVAHEIRRLLDQRQASAAVSTEAGNPAASR